MSQYDFTAWPVHQDALNVAGAWGVTLRDAQDQAWVEATLTAVADEVTRLTHRQFVASEEAETRYFDGSGTGAQEIDEIVELDEVEVVGYLQATGLVLQNAELRSDNTYPKTTIIINRGTLPAFAKVWLDRFPRGRQNIAVTGTWGYGPTIPADLWMAVLQEAMRRLYDQSLVVTSADGGGRVSKWAEGSASETMELQKGEFVFSREDFEATCRRYARPLSKRLRAATPGVI